MTEQTGAVLQWTCTAAAEELHRDLSPDNFMLVKDGTLKILDLGAAKELNVNTGASFMLVAKSGFSPHEQYSQRGGSGPWTDVYAVAATMYYAMTRVVPPSAVDRIEEDTLNWDLPELRALPREAIAALTHALAVRTQDRTQSMEQFLGELQGGAPAAKAAPKAAAPAKPVKPAEAPKPKKKSPLPVILVILAVLLLGAAAGYFLFRRNAASAACAHEWTEATCTAPRTCRVCGATEGEPLGHDMREATCAEHAKCTRCGYEANGLKAHTWVPADCVTPRTCSVCGATDGAPLGHDFAPATCTEPKTCRTCGLTEGEPIKIQVGDYITFGQYEQDNNTSNGQEAVEWLVLDVQGSQALVISRYGLDTKPYNTERTSVTWETCSLRAWLNNDFLNAAFSAEEQEAILLMTVDNSQSQCYSGYSTTGGNNTQDKVFLLSYAEANKYLGVTSSSNMESRTSPTAYAIANGAYTSSSNKTSAGAAAGWWWLRSPGCTRSHAAYVHSDGALGYYYVSLTYGMVRPTLKINLDSGLF